MGLFFSSMFRLRVSAAGVSIICTSADPDKVLFYYFIRRELILEVFIFFGHSGQKLMQTCSYFLNTFVQKEIRIFTETFGDLSKVGTTFLCFYRS